MTKHITLFDTTAEYNNADLDLPNVSYTLDDLKVHYNPYEIKLVTKYNVTSTSSATKILDDSSNISAIEIDGTTLNSVVTSYTFNTTGEHTIKYTLTDNTNINSSVFFGCSSMTSITIPNSVTSIDGYAFYNCQGLTSITIPNSIASIGESAFQNCKDLTSVTIPGTLTSIGESAFEGCIDLTSMTIENSVTSIGNRAFCGCFVLTTLTIQATTPPTLGSNALLDTNTNLVIKVPSASVNTYKSATGWNSYASKIQSI